MAEGGIPTPCRLGLSTEASAQAQQWEEWLEELQLYFCAAAIKEDKQKCAMLFYLGGSDLRAIYATLKDTDKTFESAIEALNFHFLQKKNTTFERYLFNSAIQGPYENPKSFIVRLKKLGQSCDFEKYNLEEAVVDKFIISCKSDKLRRKLLSTDNLHLEELVKKAVSMEIVDEQATKMATKIENVNIIDSESPSGSSDFGEVNAMRKGFPLQCWGCGETGHIIHDPTCDASTKACRACGFIGHFKNHCRNEKGKGAKKWASALHAEDSDPDYKF